MKILYRAHDGYFSRDQAHSKEDAFVFAENDGTFTFSHCETGEILLQVKADSKPSQEEMFRVYKETSPTKEAISQE